MQKITKYLCAIIKQAGKMTNKHFNIYDKDEVGDIVTDVDRDVEAFLITKLNQKYPNFTIVSEEYYPNNDITTNCFIVDPIDGTKNFASGIPLWGMQLAAIQDGEMVASVIYLPMMDELYYADSDGAYCNGERLEMTATIQAKRPIYEVAGGNRCQALLKLEKEINRNFRYFGSSAFAFSLVASGRLSGFILRKDTKWDYLPGIFLVKMAGGYIKDEPGIHIGATNKKMLDILSQYPDKPEKKVKK